MDVEYKEKGLLLLFSFQGGDSKRIRPRGGLKWTLRVDEDNAGIQESRLQANLEIWPKEGIKTIKFNVKTKYYLLSLQDGLGTRSVVGASRCGRGLLSRRLSKLSFGG